MRSRPKIKERNATAGKATYSIPALQELGLERVLCKSKVIIMCIYFFQI